MTAVLSLLAGVLLGLLSPAIPGTWWHCAGVALLAVWALSCWRHLPGSAACAALLAGQVLAGAHAHHWMARQLADPAGNPRLLAEGRIAGIPERDGVVLRFNLRVESQVPRSAGARDRLLRVEWRDPQAAPRVGERWRLLLRVQPLEETRNFSGLDVARLAFRDGVHGRARVLESALNERLELAPASLDTLRARIAARVRESIADPDAAALVTALAVGITAGMSHEQWRVFNATGTTHLVAISGLHVTLFAWLAFRAARLLWGRLPGRQYVAREPFALLSGLAAAGGYALLAGLSVPTQRTWIMLGLYVAARLSARRVGAGRLWSLALVLVLLSDARAPLAAGFWLSFIAVGVLLAFADDAHQDAGVFRWRTALRAQLIVMLALMPAGLAIFGGVSLVGLVVNLVAIPVISLAFVPLVLGGALLAWLAPAWDAPIFGLAALLHDGLWPGLVWCAEFDMANLASTWRAAPPSWWFLLALPASLVWLCRWPWRLRLTATCALLPLVFAPPRSPAPGHAHIEVLDAGRGSAALVRTASHALLFDTGDTWNTRGSRLAGIVLPALHDAQLQRVDALVLPALDEDRARAAALLALEHELATVRVGGGWPGNGFAMPCRDSRWSWDGVDLATYAVGRHCVLRISTGDVGLLLPGDLDAAGERALLARVAPSELASDAVLIGRQASEQASSRQWIESLSPGLAIATGGSDGAQSRQRVLARWRAQGARVLDTRQDGAVVLAISARGLEALALARTARYPFHWRRPV